MECPCVRRAGRQIYVDGSAAPDLLRQGARAAEGVARLRLDPSQHLRQRRRREDDRASGGSVFAPGSIRPDGPDSADDGERNRRAESEPRPHRSTITLVDLTIPVALMPAFNPSSSADSRVMMATTRAGSVTSISTFASRPSTSTERTTPRKRFRAESSSEPAAPRRRSISRAGTTRRLAASRSTPILLEDEARNNLILGLAGTLRDRPGYYPEFRLWLVEDGSEVVAAALQTPPFNLVLAQPADAAAATALADAVASEGIELPGVVGAKPEVDLFVDGWETRGMSTRRLRRAQRIYRLADVRFPTRVRGAPRVATGDD